jgi:hypothetical protein
MFEIVSQSNWPAARVRNTVKQYVEHRTRQFMPIHPEPPKRMARDAGIAWLAATAGIGIFDLELMNPVLFVQQYVLGSREPAEGIKAFRMVHGTGSMAGVGPDGGAEPWMVDMARRELEAPPVVPAMTPVEDVVRWLAEQQPAAAVEVAVAAAEAAPAAEPPAVRLDALADTVEVATGNADTLAFLSDRLVAVEVRMGLPVDAVPGTSQMDLMGRMLGIMTKIVDMNV